MTELRIERSFESPAEDVFDAWTSPEVMRRWFHCGPDWATPVAEVDLRVGGRVRVVMRRPDGSTTEAYGEYTQIERPRRLVMEWTFGDDPANQQLLDISFQAHGGSTTVLLVNTLISSEEQRSSQDRGWRACLDELERALTG